MARRCRDCDYKNKYDNLLKKYEKQEKLVTALENQKHEIVKEIIKYLTDSNGNPKDQIIEYAKKVNRELQSGDTQYKTILHTIYILLDILIGLSFIVVSFYIYYTKDLSGIQIYLPLIMLTVIMYLSHLDLKKKTETEAFNSLAFLIAVISLLVSLLK